MHFACCTSSARYFTYQEADISVKPSSIHLVVSGRREAGQIVLQDVSRSFLALIEPMPEVFQDAAGKSDGVTHELSRNR